MPSVEAIKNIPGKISHFINIPRVLSERRLAEAQRIFQGKITEKDRGNYRQRLRDGVILVTSSLGGSLYYPTLTASQLDKQERLMSEIENLPDEVVDERLTQQAEGFLAQRAKGSK